MSTTGASEEPPLPEAAVMPARSIETPRRSVTPGWYIDPQDTARLRWWNGDRWTATTTSRTSPTSDERQTPDGSSRAESDQIDAKPIKSALVFEGSAASVVQPNLVGVADQTKSTESDLNGQQLTSDQPRGKRRFLVLLGFAAVASAIAVVATFLINHNTNQLEVLTSQLVSSGGPLSGASVAHPVNGDEPWPDYFSPVAAVEISVPSAVNDSTLNPLNAILLIQFSSRTSADAFTQEQSSDLSNSPLYVYECGLSFIVARIPRDLVPQVSEPFSASPDCGNDINTYEPIGSNQSETIIGRPEQETPSAADQAESDLTAKLSSLDVLVQEATTDAQSLLGSFQLGNCVTIGLSTPRDDVAAANDATAEVIRALTGAVAQGVPEGQYDGPLQQVRYDISVANKVLATARAANAQVHAAKGCPVIDSFGTISAV